MPFKSISTNWLDWLVFNLNTLDFTAFRISVRTSAISVLYSANVSKSTYLPHILWSDGMLTQEFKEINIFIIFSLFYLTSL